MQKRFTLIELIVVVSILGILASIIIPNIQNIKSDAIAANIKSSIHTLQTASDIYSLEHNGEFPVLEQPTIFEPKKIDFDVLYPKYITNKPKQNVYYWIDYSGKVWGSTAEAPSDFFESDSFIEWKNNSKIKEYHIYEVVDKKTTSDVVNGKLVPVTTIVNSQSDLVQLEKEQKKYLISGVDEYNLETVPVGLSYQQLQDWFKPIQNEEGVFNFELIRDEDMVFEGYQVQENKPEGTSITYEFATEKDNFTTYISDIKQLPPSKHLKVKITTKSYSGKFPSLYSMNIYFHLSKEPRNVVSVTHEPTIPTFIPQSQGEVYRGQLGANEQLLSISKPFGYSSSAMEIWYSVSGIARKASSLTEIPSGSSFYIWIGASSNQSSPSSSDSNTSYPIVVSSPNVVVQKVNADTKQEQPPKEEAEKWNTIQTVTFMVSSQNKVKWLRAEYDQVVPEGTRIDYSFASGDGITWSPKKGSISELESSYMLMVTANLMQSTKLVDKSIVPKVNSIRIFNSEGTVDSALNKPTVAFTDMSAVYEAGSPVSWAYTTNDPLGRSIVNVEWSGNKKDSYTTDVTAHVGLRVQNSDGIWSDWVYKDVSILNTVFGSGALGNATIESNVTSSNTSAKITAINQNKVTYGTKVQGTLGGDFAVGDEIMLYASNGSTASITGNYDFYKIESIASGELTLDRAISASFTPTTSQIIKVPNYNNLTIGNGITVSPMAYNGSIGGVLVFRATGKVELNGSLNASFKGYKHGYTAPNNGTIDSSKGGNPSYSGASNQFKGGNGGSSYQGNLAVSPSVVGQADIASSKKVYMGGGSASSTGGGIIMIFANEISFNTSYAISSNGKGGTSTYDGGAAGGSVVLYTNTISGLTNNFNYAIGATGGGGGGEWCRNKANVDYPTLKGTDGANIGGGKGATYPAAGCSGSISSGGIGFASNGGGGAKEVSNGVAASISAGGAGATGNYTYGWNSGAGGGGGGYIAIYTPSKSLTGIPMYPAPFIGTLTSK